jgi:hypothetical protein
LPGAGPGDAEEVGDLGPGVVLVTGVGDGLGKSAFGLGGKAGEEMKGDAGVAGPELPSRAQVTRASSSTASVSSPVAGAR